MKIHKEKNRLKDFKVNPGLVKNHYTIPMSQERLQ